MFNNVNINTIGYGGYCQRRAVLFRRIVATVKFFIGKKPEIPTMFLSTSQSSSRALSLTFVTYVLYPDGRNAFDGYSIHPPGEQSSLCFDVPTIRELMAVEGHEPVKRKLSAVLCRWSTNFAPASILPSSISTTLIEQTALKPDPCSRACNWNGRSACLHVYVLHVAVKAVWWYLALGLLLHLFSS